MDLFPDSKELLALFIANNVRFLVIGGHALAAHGLPRGTDDFDLWLWADFSNAVQVLVSLEEFGFGDTGVTLQDLTSEDRVIQLGTSPARIDLLTSISGVKFEDAWAARLEVVVDGMKVPFIGRTHLVINKWSSGRPQDLVDLMKLIRQAQRE